MAVAPVKIYLGHRARGYEHVTGFPMSQGMVTCDSQAPVAKLKKLKKNPPTSIVEIGSGGACRSLAGILGESVPGGNGELGGDGGPGGGGRRRS